MSSTPFKSNQEFDIAVLKPSMTTKRIKEVMADYSGIRFEVGVYNLTEPLILRSDQNVMCDEGVVFKRKHGGRMLMSEVTPSTVKYKGIHDSTWLGGKFVADTNKKAANVITLFHAKNILLEDIVVEGCVNYHSLEINASRDITVNNCTFKKQTYDGKDDFREAIQIDFANYDGLKVDGATNTSKCYDGTHCKNITINDCTFDNVPNGVGTHTVAVATTIYHTDIKISFCTFKNISNRAVKIAGMKSVLVNCVIGSNTDVYVNNLTKAHQCCGGTVELDEPRMSKDVLVKIYDKNKKKCIQAKYI